MIEMFFAQYSFFKVAKKFITVNKSAEYSLTILQIQWQDLTDVHKDKTTYNTVQSYQVINSII